MKATLWTACAVAGAALIGATPAGAQNLTGEIKVDGSSTVFPITEAVAEEFQKEHPGVKVTVGVSGTGGGFKRFAKGETDISNASRPIKGEEIEAGSAASVEFIEIPVAYDGLSIVVNPSNDWASEITVDDLKKIFLSSPAVNSWKDVRPEYPDVPLRIFSPGTDSGTFDYFKEVVAHEKDTSIRSDMSVSEDDNTLVTGVAGDRGAIGYFGSAYYFENKDKVKALPVINKAGKPVMPSKESVTSGDYNPLSRPLFIYVNAKSAARPEVKEFVEFYIDEAADMSSEVGYIPLPDSVYDKAEKNFAKKKTGSAYMKDGKKVEGAVTEVYQ